MRRTGGAPGEAAIRPVLVTGGEYRIALAATRALGRRGVPVAVLASDPWAITFHSRYCSQRILTPPDHHRADYQRFLVGLVERQRFAGVLFCDDLAAQLAGEIRAELAPHLPLLLPRQDWVDLTLDKRRMLRHASAAGVAMPATAFPDSADQVEAAVRGFRTPLLVKGVRGDSSRHLRVCRSGTTREVVDAFEEIAALERAQGLEERPLVQEYVAGDVYSAIVLADQGVVVACFVMKKLRTWPSWGGVCVEGESVHDEAALAAVRAYFAQVPWHGVAEVEFIRDARDGAYRFVELNPDFNWGLDFAVQAGVDFPWLACRMMAGERLRPADAPSYRSGRRFVWFLPEGARYLRRSPAELPAFLLKLLDPSVGTDLALDDPGALARQLRRLFA